MGRVHKEDDLAIFNAVLDSKGVRAREVVQTNAQNSVYNSFKVTVDRSYAVKMRKAAKAADLSPLWPAHIIIRRWTEKNAGGEPERLVAQPLGQA